MKRVALLQLLFYISTHQEVTGDICQSEQFTSSGECCSLCPAGSGLVSKCGLNNTKCQPCQDGLTFSDKEGLSGCQECSKCPQGIPQLARCTVTQDTMCDCGQNYFLKTERNSTLCAPCKQCRLGEGVMRACGVTGNTVCQPCGPGTYSEEISNKACMPCSSCNEGEEELRECQANSDTVCMDRNLHVLSKLNGSEAPWELPRRPGLIDDENQRKNGMSAVPDTNPQDSQGGNILIYVSVLASVVLGLLIYVAYKCWKSFQQKAALGKARAAELNNVVEGEKLHSDSGVFLDSHSLQENKMNKGDKRDSRLYTNLPPHQHEEVEKLLAEGGARSWQDLARVLGYGQERVELFSRGEDPVHTLLTDWAQQESSTLELLSSALNNIERHDVAVALNKPNQGITMV